ncbi:MAG: hypothetical protein ABIM85_00355 [candidate division WOR-3 bacterium]
MNYSFYYSFLVLIFFFQLFNYTVDIEKSPFYKENTEFLLDSWKYNFGLKTLGGGYIRHILLLTDSNIIDIETNQISHTPGYTRVSYISEILEGYIEESSEEKILRLPLELIAVVILSNLLPSPEKRMQEEIKKVINLTSKNPTAENFINAIKVILKGSEVKHVWKYKEITNIDIKRKRKEVHFKFVSNEKKQDFISKYESEEKAQMIENILKNLLTRKRENINSE